MTMVLIEQSSQQSGLAMLEKKIKIRSKDMIIGSFKKCGITTNVMTRKINIPELEDYVMPVSKEEFHLETSLREKRENGEWEWDAAKIERITTTILILKKHVPQKMKAKIRMN